jgi:hypothetical protein
LRQRYKLKQIEIIGTSCETGLTLVFNLKFIYSLPIADQNLLLPTIIFKTGLNKVNQIGEIEPSICKILNLKS